MRLISTRGILRQEKRGYIEAVIRQFHDSHLFIRTNPRDPELSFGELIPETRIEPIVAGELLHDFLLSIRLAGKRAWSELYCLSRSDERTG